jgi:hypothetical protein
MSSLESDTSDLTLSGSETGMTQFGFKGASSGDRTGDYRQEVIRKKRRLTLVIGIVSAVGVLILLVALYFVLRAAAPQPKLNQTDALSQTEPLTPLPEDLQSGTLPADGNTSPTPNNDAPPFPETGASNLGYEDALNDASTQKPSDGLAPIKPPTLTSDEPKAADPTPTVSPSSNSGSSLNPKVSPSRTAAIMAAFQTKQFPTTPTEMLQMADDFNDIGKLAEANVCYQKASEMTGITPKETISALGGMAVTYKNMGMKPEALRIVEKLLAIQPKNRFALGLKADLQ